MTQGAEGMRQVVEEGMPMTDNLKGVCVDNSADGLMFSF